LALVLGVLIRLTSDASIYSSLDDKTWTAALHSAVGAISQMAAAVAAQDLAGVDIASRRYVLICRQLVDASLLHQRKPIPPDVTQRAYDVFPPSRPMKKADRVEREIRQMIFDHSCKLGSNLGSEVELAQRFGVGRSVLREALRSLEQLGVIEMGVGSSSGLRIVSPDPTAIVQPAQRHLRREGLGDHHRRQVRDLLENLRAKERPPSHIGSLFQQILAT
jgi:DNA-binding transcriptional regulator YhcF (GntR family)